MADLKDAMTAADLDCSKAEWKASLKVDSMEHSTAENLEMWTVVTTA